MRIIGIMPAYNEEDVIRDSCRALARYCDEVHVFDHGSTDKTPLVLEAMSRETGTFVHRLDRTEIPPVDKEGHQSFALWEHLAAFAISQVSRFDWLVWSDADDFLREPDGRLATHEGIERVAAQGFQVIRPLIRIFTRTDKDPSEGSYFKRIRYFRTVPRGHAPRAWEIGLTPPDLPAGAHIQDPATLPKTYDFYHLWPAGTRVLNNVWLNDQYPFRSDEQMQGKLDSRNWISPTGGKRYEDLRRGGGDKKTAVGLTRETRELETP